MARDPYNLKIGDTGVRAQVVSCSQPTVPPGDTFLVGVAGVDGTEAYTTGDCGGRGVMIAYARAAQAYNVFDWVKFDVIGTFNDGRGILISNIQPA